MILERIDYKELHPNGTAWITGTIAVIAPLWAHLYNTIGFVEHPGKITCRIGILQNLTILCNWGGLQCLTPLFKTIIPYICAINKPENNDKNE